MRRELEWWTLLLVSVLLCTVGVVLSCGGSAKDRAAAKAAEDVAMQGLQDLCRIVEEDRLARALAVRDAGAD